MKLKSYNKFFEEITIVGNQGVPGEGSDKSEPKYLSDVERRAKGRLEITGRENPQQFGMEIMNLVSRSANLIRGKEKELEDLAKDVILSEYGSILDGVGLDIKMVKPGEVKMDDSDEEEEEEEMPKFRLLKDPDVKKEVDKAKILNNIIQGEAKNTKNILHSEVSKNGINKIFGDRGEEIFGIWDRISKLADKMDWIIPIDIKADMMERAPQGLAGCVKVEWKPKEKKEEDDDNDILKKIEDEENEEEYSEPSTEPTIIARGIDFPMLLHETVKGIYELISAHSIVDDEELANTIKMNVSSFEDEAQDFRYGPEMASDLRDFVNAIIDEKTKTNQSILKYRNLREFVFGKMVDRNYLNTDDFLKLFKGILSKSNESKSKISSIIDEILSELGEFDKKETSRDIDEIITKSATDAPNPTKKMSKSEIQDAIDSALDSGDFSKVGEFSRMMDELYPQK